MEGYQSNKKRNERKEGEKSERLYRKKKHKEKNLCNVLILM
jgi:hypothetical protein